MIADPAGFIRAYTAPGRPPLVPEIGLRLADEETRLWHATAAALEDAGCEPPFWAFAWPGGQALARYVLDRPSLVAGRRVLDLGAGSGIVAIAAARAGAAAVSASDIDPFAQAVIAINAAANGVAVALAADDPPGRAAALADVILAGDVFYDRAMAARLEPWLRARAAEGRTVLIADPGRAYLPADGLEPLARYAVPTHPAIEEAPVRETTVYRVSSVRRG